MSPLKTHQNVLKLICSTGTYHFDKKSSNLMPCQSLPALFWIATQGASIGKFYKNEWMMLKGWYGLKGVRLR